jgi:hypothetical protein
MPSLAEYLARAARLPFRWGQTDCATFIADWVLVVTGRDGMASLRGRYGCPDVAGRLHGPLGLTGTVRRCARLAGLVRTSSPRPGDIAVVRHGREIGCAIRTSRGWALRIDRGLVVVPAARVIAAWTVPADTESQAAHG